MGFSATLAIDDQSEKPEKTPKNPNPFRCETCNKVYKDKTGAVYEGNFKNGEKDGLIHEWFENGQLQYRMNYKNGEYDGKLEKWYENGQLLYEQIWENGQLVKVTNYKDNGEIK